MIESRVNQWMSAWSEEAHARVIAGINDPYPLKTQFRVCERPIFLDSPTLAALYDATDSILAQLQTPEFTDYAKDAVPKLFYVPGETDHPEFVQIDFALTPEGPKLIELQGFASMFCYQVALDRAYRAQGLVEPDLTCYHSGLTETDYLAELTRLICRDHAKENVVLLELDPESQRTQIDFACTEAMCGIRTVNVRDVRRSGNELYAEVGGETIEIHRIYNRVIFDEVDSKCIRLKWDPREGADVEWSVHPNWFLRISKHTLPFLRGPSIPRVMTVEDLAGTVPEDLDRYVLKPMYSFAGAGVVMNPTPNDLAAVTNPQYTLLQERVEYAPVMETPAGPRCAEVRMMVFWDKAPKVVNSLVRVSSGGQSTVSKNDSEPWVGATTAYFPKTP